MFSIILVCFFPNENYLNTCNYIFQMLGILWGNTASGKECMDQVLKHHYHHINTYGIKGQYQNCQFITPIFCDSRYTCMWMFALSVLSNKKRSHPLDAFGTIYTNKNVRTWCEEPASVDIKFKVLSIKWKRYRLFSVSLWVRCILVLKWRLITDDHTKDPTFETNVLAKSEW